MNDPAEIGYDDLDCVDGRFLRHGRPFTGVTIDRDAQGRKRCEVPFLAGHEHGTSRSWHPNGRLAAETPYIHGGRHGTHREWFDDGSLHIQIENEFGWMMRKEVRNRTGEVAERYERPASDAVYQSILRKRAAHPRGPQPPGFEVIFPLPDDTHP